MQIISEILFIKTILNLKYQTQISILEFSKVYFPDSKWLTNIFFFFYWKIMEKINDCLVLWMAKSYNTFFFIIDITIYNSAHQIEQITIKTIWNNLYDQFNQLFVLWKISFVACVCIVYCVMKKEWKYTQTRCLFGI